MSSDQNADTPTALDDLIYRHGVVMGGELAEFGQQIATRMDATIKAAFTHGVVEGLELCAQTAELWAAQCEQVHPDVPVLADLLRSLRDAIRLCTLNVDMPT